MGIGIIVGLAEAGLDMTGAADLVIGTSSGATAAAQRAQRDTAARTVRLSAVPPVQAVDRAANDRQPCRWRLCSSA